MVKIYDHRGEAHDTRRAERDRADEWWNSKRRWEGAETNRLNEGHWKLTGEADINDELDHKLKVLRQRSVYEIANNPIVSGMVETHKVDLIGQHGPRLTVVPVRRDGSQTTEADRQYAEALQSLWHEWWESPDINRQMSGADILRQNLGMLWTSGEFLNQLVTDRSAPGPIKLRINPIHPNRLKNPISTSPRGTTVLGIERNSTGRPLRYHIDGRKQAIDARNMIHGYRIDEPGQARGVPWLASVLQTIADLRDYDAQTLDSARQANDYAVLLESNSADLEPIEVNQSVEIERRRISTLPPGWTVHQLKPEQPSANYAEFRRERLKDFGRPVSMPGLIVTLDASKHNFSSSRFDARSYDTANGEKQSWLERTELNPLVREVEREGQSVLPAKPEGVTFEFRWSWGRQSHIAADPSREAKAQETKLLNRTTTFADELAKEGKDLETHIAQLEREQRRLSEAGLRFPDPTLRDESVGELFKRAIEEHMEEAQPQGGQE